MNRTNPSSGFTLIELLVAVSIVGILAALAYPSYREHITHTRRADMQSELLNLAGFLERKHAEFGCYDYGKDYDCTTTDDSELPPLDDKHDYDLWEYKYYDVTVGANSLGNHTYRLEAKPKGSQAGDGVLYIDQGLRKSWDENNDTKIDNATELNWHRG